MKLDHFSDLHTKQSQTDQDLDVGLETSTDSLQETGLTIEFTEWKDSMLKSKLVTWRGTYRVETSLLVMHPMEV